MSDLGHVLHVIVNHLPIAPYEKDVLHEKVTALDPPIELTGEEETPNAE